MLNETVTKNQRSFSLDWGAMIYAISQLLIVVSSRHLT